MLSQPFSLEQIPQNHLASFMVALIKYQHKNIDGKIYFTLDKNGKALPNDQ